MVKTGVRTFYESGIEKLITPYDKCSQKFDDFVGKQVNVRSFIKQKYFSCKYVFSDEGVFNF